MTSLTLRAAGRAAAFAFAVSSIATGASAQQILSWTESEETDGDDDAPRGRDTSTVAGGLASTSFGGTDARARTDFGVNKIFASGNGIYDVNATSLWSDSYTVSGAAGTMVNVSFTIGIDGSSDILGDDYSYNFKLYALKGSGWTAHGYASDADWPANTALFYTPPGDENDRIFLTQTRSDGAKVQMDARDFEGFANIAPNGDFFSQVKYDPATGTFTRTTVDGNMNWIEEVFTPTTYQRIVNGLAVTPQIPLSASSQLQQGRANLVSYYPILGMAQLCTASDNECGAANYPGSDLTVSFSLLAGSTFSLAGMLFADDVGTGTVDFFNTARLTGVSVSQGGSLSSGSGSLLDLGGGNYGYAAALGTGAVPEPGTWALFILGFGLVGAAMRRRRTRLAYAL
ncbi:PEPxxWA-CTERM sorting domain-containing protein [Qipengyuania sp.]|uniref:PEPxxWA-CTERM sorting domain-containing protein n=1 Tax=Qipengyuania sp. TaxID=2004515 RepID=UPI0035C7DA9A